jgi:hypothetical protein
MPAATANLRSASEIVTSNGDHPSMGARFRHLLPRPVRRVAARMVAGRMASRVEQDLELLARDRRSILLGPWLGEVGFELLYWIPFLRWFAGRYGVAPQRLIAVSRGGASAWYAGFVARSHDALTFMSQEEFRRKNADRTERLGEQKQIAWTPLDEEIVALVRDREQSDVAVLHPSTMYRLFAPYWWGHRPLTWVHQFADFAPIRPPSLGLALPLSYTAVKFYFNDCFRNTPENRAFVDDTIRALVAEGPVISLSTGVSLDDHAPCEPDVAAMHEIRHLLVPQSNLAVQSAIVAGARRFVGTYGGFAYLAPLCGVPAVSYYSEPGSFSTRHLDLMRDVLRSRNDAGLLELIPVRREAGR